MKFNNSEFTGAVNKVKEMLNGEKPGQSIMLTIGESKVDVKTYDGKKAFIEKVGYIREEGDLLGDIVINFDKLTRALDNCQPNGRIIVDEIQFTFKENNIITLKAEQKCMIDIDDTSSQVKVLSVKEMDLKWTKAEDTMVGKLLLRMKYDEIFDQSDADRWDVSELSSVLGKTSTEKTRIVYMSPSIQKVFVVNTAHVTAVPVSKLDIDDLSVLSCREELKKAGNTDEEIEKAVSNMYNRLNNPATISTNNVKKICGILNKLGKDSVVFSYIKDGYFNLFNEDETIGVRFRMDQGNQAQMSQFTQYNNKEYDSYQINFVREFFADSIKTALSAISSDKTVISFKKNDNDELEMVISAVNSGASVNDTYYVLAEQYIDNKADIENRKLTVNLKLMNEMVSQLNETMIAFDLTVYDNNQACLRIGDINEERLAKCYYSKKEELGLNDIEPVPNVEKVKYRVETLDTCQYAMLG